MSSPMRFCLLLVALVGLGCHSSTQTREGGAEPAPPSTLPQGQAPAEVEPAPLSPEREAELRALPWVGDADAHRVKPFQGRWAQSGSWGPEQDGRRSLTSAGYGLRTGALTQDMAYVIADTTPEGLLVKFYDGQSFTDADIRFSMPLKGSVETLWIEAAHDKLAVLTTDGAQPQLSVYAQADKAQAWSRPLEIADATGPLVLAWHPDQTLSVEWRSAKNYQRLLFDGETGVLRVQQALDPRILAVIQAPVDFILAAPPPAEDPEPIDDTKLTNAQRWSRTPPQAIAAACPSRGHMHDADETRVARAIELDPGILLAAEALHFTDARREPRPLSAGAVHCTSVELYDAEKIHSLGRWSTFRPEV